MLLNNTIFKMWILLCFLFIYASNLHNYLPPLFVNSSTYFQFYMVINRGFNTNRIFLLVECLEKHFERSSWLIRTLGQIFKCLIVRNNGDLFYMFYFGDFFMYLMLFKLSVFYFQLIIVVCKMIWETKNSRNERDIQLSIIQNAWYGNRLIARKKCVLLMKVSFLKMTDDYALRGKKRHSQRWKLLLTLL